MITRALPFVTALLLASSVSAESVRIEPGALFPSDWDRTQQQETSDEAAGLIRAF